MGAFDNILMNLPEVAGPTQKRLSFKEKLKWTLLILIIFFFLGLIPLYGIEGTALEEFELLEMILGAEFGKITSLGIGPIVTASIVLQLLNGSGILKFDTTTQEGKKRFQGVQKLLALFFILFEAIIYVQMGGFAPKVPELAWVIIVQLFLGGLLIMLMDEIVSKWGFGSGISLFIAAGVSKSVFIRGLSWVERGGAYVGAVPQMFQAFAQNNPLEAGLQLASIIATIVVFAMAVYGQAMKIEIPLSFGRVRGQGIRWPLQFIYTSNIPVILVAALLANLQLWARLMQNWANNAGGVVMWISQNIVGQYNSSGSPTSGLLQLVSPTNIVRSIIEGTLTFEIVGRTLAYILIMITGAVIFSWFWVQTSGMDARSQAKQIMSSGLQIPGFRKDQRVLERLLERYIKPLTIMGAIAVGILAAVADVTGALANGTGLLLTVMILYRLYEEIAKQHMMDLSPGMRKYMTI